VLLMLVLVVLILCAIGVLRAAAQLGVARLCQLPVDRFSIGLGPAIWKRTSRTTGTTFQVTRLPLGAFVRVRDDGDAARRRFATVSAALASTYLAVSLVALAFFASYGIDDGRRWSASASCSTATIPQASSRPAIASSRPTASRCTPTPACP
jgi:membrane-associated protease RseP (regulator of RpoE activity)